MAAFRDLPDLFRGSGKLPRVSATSPSPARVGARARSLAAGLAGTAVPSPRLEGAEPGPQPPAAGGPSREACGAPCRPRPARPPLRLPERSRALRPSRSAKREPRGGRRVSRAALQASLSRCSEGRSGPDTCLSIAALRAGRANPSKPRAEPLVRLGPRGLAAQASCA